MRGLRLRASGIGLPAARSLGIAAALMLAAVLPQQLAAAPVPPPLKIGIIGSGHIGGTLATLVGQPRATRC